MTKSLMKRSVFAAFVLAVPLLLFGLASCGHDLIVDWAPVELVLKVQDAQGNDLLDPENEHNVIDGTSIRFQGETYYASREWYDRYMNPDTVSTKAILAVMYGLLLANDDMLYTNTGTFSLYFGEIDGALDMDEDLVVTWPDGSQNVVHYHCSKHNENKLTCKRIWKLDGVATESNVITIIK